MIDAIGKHAPSVDASILLIEAAEEVPAPPPLLGPRHERRGIDRFDLAPVVENSVLDIVHGRTRRTDIAVRRVPEARLVVGNVGTETAVRVRAPPADEMLYPSLLKERIGRHVGVVRIVAGNILAVCPYAVPGIRE